MSQSANRQNENPRGVKWAWPMCPAHTALLCFSLTPSVVLQALPADPPPHAKCKDKFLVQSAFIPPDEEMHSLPEMVG